MSNDMRKYMDATKKLMESNRPDPAEKIFELIKASDYSKAIGLLKMAPKELVVDTLAKVTTHVTTTSWNPTHEQMLLNIATLIGETGYGGEILAKHPSLIGELFEISHGAFGRELGEHNSAFAIATAEAHAFFKTIGVIGVPDDFWHSDAFDAVVDEIRDLGSYPVEDDDDY